MERRTIGYKNYFKDFFESLDKDVQEKILYVLLLVESQDRIPSKYIKSIDDGLFELRIEYNGNIYRIFFCFDAGRIVILFNAFQKKSQKTPKNEIEKAKRLKKEYDESRKKR
ncbi:MAG: type II toxin-antitoxin system RelE/ParE family toxin [Mediterranea sp.]|jgi:putative addiction module killer protein|nr:type II toxin-antitoxin system RelE/ParE family toxin [Mediterranea sp.]